MDYKDYYKVMGVSPSATPKEIKLAYRRLARKYHPDVSKEKDAEMHFKEIGEAYEVLQDPEKRKIYDEYRRGGTHQQASQRASNQYTSSAHQTSYESPDDFFEFLFGSRPFEAQYRPNLDLHGTINISLEEAVNGAVKDIQLPTNAPSGPSTQTLRVKIPAGIQSGQQIRLNGQGALGANDGARGDVYLSVQINKHSFYDVIGRDIYVTLPVTPWEVALGSTVTVPTLAGTVELKIPEGSQGGQKLRLKKRGLPGAEPGDQYVILKIVTPKPVTDTAKALYKKMAEEMPLNPRAHMGGKS